MNGKKGSVEINNPPAIKAKQPEVSKKSDFQGFSCKAWIWNVWEVCKEDSNRVTFSFKAGLAFLLVSLLILLREPYEIFGINIIWSILTVAIVFECTVGATFNRGFNRALGSLLAGIAVAQLAQRTGRVAEPVIIGISIFFIGAITSFMKLWPSFAPYEYGFRVILFTYCLIIVSGYRMGNPIRTAMDRPYSIAIGGFVTVFVNVLVFTIWAGEQLHKELVNSFNSLADSLEECVKKYLEDDGLDHPEFSKTVMDEFPDEPAYRKCRTTLNSSAKLESLVIILLLTLQNGSPHMAGTNTSSIHGHSMSKLEQFFDTVLMRLWHSMEFSTLRFRYSPPSLLRAYSLAYHQLQGCVAIYLLVFRSIDGTLQHPNHIPVRDSRCNKPGSRASEGLGQRHLQHEAKPQKLPAKEGSQLNRATQHAIDMHSYLLTAHSDPPDNSKPLPKHSHALSSTLYDLPEQLDDVDSTSLENSSNQQTQNMRSGTFPPAQTESYHEMRKQSRRLHSWPSREVDAFEEAGGFSTDLLPRMRALESTAALSLATFTSLLIEFVVRLDHLVEAVDELSKMAKFKHEGL
ncbi:hypothetical protein CRYUN_Cryun07bG0147700 [Craigia yunnanensis]